jgi:hypothetical protein
MAQSRKKDAQIISLDAFGSAKNYWLCWVRSPLPHFSFANNVCKQLGRPLAYVGNITLADEHPDLAFPMYFTTFNRELDANLVILANHVTAPMDLSLGQQNPLLGGLLFEDDYYLFNDGGLTKIRFSFPQADYILLLSADKQADIEDYTQLLSQIKGISFLCQNTPQNIASSQKKSKSVLDFLQYLFYESEGAVKEYQRRKLFQKLHHKLSVAENNFEHLRFPLENNRILTSALLRRDDF